MPKTRLLSCPNPDCGEPVQPEDRYCEACGTLIPAFTVTAVPAAAARPNGRPTSRPGSGPDSERVEVAYPDLAGVSDRGLRRSSNEDALALARIEGRDARVLVVCDGVSASAEPARASRVAAEAAVAWLAAAAEHGNVQPEHAMQEAVAAAQRAVCAVSYRLDGADGPPATTLVAALLQEGQATIGWVGDSRAYFVGPSAAWQLSRDDSWLEEPGEPEHRADRASVLAVRAHVLTRWLGQDREGGPEASITTFLLPASGHLLLCSDGLWNYAPTPESMRDLVAGLSADATPLELTRGLTEFARSAGGADNITVAAASMEEARHRRH
jgi:PPM family protein phosphatase